MSAEPHAFGEHWRALYARRLPEPIPGEVTLTLAQHELELVHEGLQALAPRGAAIELAGRVRRVLEAAR